MADEAVILNSNEAPWVIDEAPAISGETDIHPGMAVTLDSNGEIKKHANEPNDVTTAAVSTGLIAVLSRSDPTLTKSDAYNADDDQEQVHYAYVPIGGKFDARLAAGGDLDDSSLANVSEGDLLEEVDNGAFAQVRRLTATQTQDVGSINAQSTATFTISVSGAQTGMPVSVSPPSGLNSSLVVTSHVTSADTVTVTVLNATSGSIDPSSGDYTVEVANRDPNGPGAVYRAEEGVDKSGASAGVSNQGRIEARRVA